MARVLSLSPDDHSQIQWEATNGNEVTFRVSADVVLAPGEKGVVVGYSIVENDNFPTDIPELHVEVLSDPNGSETLNVSELVTVTMANIYEEVAINFVVREGGSISKEATYLEQPGTTGRSIAPGDIGPPE